MGLSLRILDFWQNHLNFYTYTFQSQKKDSGKKPDGKTTYSCYCSNSSHIRVVWGKIDLKKEPVQWLKFRKGAIQVTAQRLRVVHRHCKNFLISCYSIIQFSLRPGDSVLCGMLLWSAQSIRQTLPQTSFHSQPWVHLPLGFLWPLYHTGKECVCVCVWVPQLTSLSLNCH